MNKNIPAGDNGYKEFLPFRFAGYWNPAYCFLRVGVVDGKIVILATQLIDYHGTSVTNSVENILLQTVKQLLEEKIITDAAVSNVFSRLTNDIVKQREIDFSKLYQFVKNKIIFIERYLPEFDNIMGDSWAIVDFSTSGAPSWTHIARENIAEILGDDSILSVDAGSISKWKDGLSAEELKNYEGI